MNMINKSNNLLFLMEQEFEYRRLDDILDTIRKLEPGEYDLSGVEAVFTTSSKKVDIDELQSFINRYHKVCYILIEGYSDLAKDLIVISDVPHKISEGTTMKDTGIITYKNRIFAKNLI